MTNELKILNEIEKAVSLCEKDYSHKEIFDVIKTENDFEKNGSFIYVGNILPLTHESIMAKVKDMEEINNQMKNTSENLAEKFKLLGSNGVDYILNDKGLYVIEINPRLQGTFECVEKSLGINMLEAHIMACRGEIIEIPKPQYYSYKKIIYSPTRMKYDEITSIIEYLTDNLNDTFRLEANINEE